MSPPAAGADPETIAVPEQKVQARLHDGSAIDVEVDGEGPTVLLPVNPVPVEGPRPRSCAGGAPTRPWAAP